MLVIIFLTQLLFTMSDIMARSNMKQYGFKIATFFSFWFTVYFLIRIVAMFGQLYIFTNNELGKTMALFSAASILLSNIIGFLLFREVLSLPAYIGISIVILGILLIAYK